MFYRLLGTRQESSKISSLLSWKSCGLKLRRREVGRKAIYIAASIDPETESIESGPEAVVGGPWVKIKMG